MKTILKIITLCTVCAMALSVASGCGSSKDKASGSSSSSKASSSSSKAASSQAAKEDYGVVDAPAVDQLEKPAAGEEIAVLTVAGYGEIKIRLFPEQAPKAVENFKALAKEGKYDGVPFHRVIQDFMAQTGDTSLNGGNGQSMWGDGFGIEVNTTLRHYSGALSMARTGDMKKGQSSQFFIVTNPNKKEMSADEFKNLETQVSATGNKVEFPDNVKSRYNEFGGSPFLDMQYSVFGQVFEGLEVVDKIGGVECAMGQDGAKSSPVEKIVIEKAEIVAYAG